MTSGISGEAEAQRRLLSRCAGGDCAAWERFLRLHGPRIHGTAAATLRRVLGSASPTDVDDIFQGVLVSLLEGRGRRLLSYQGRGDLGAWLKIVTARFALNHIRSQRTGGTLRFRPLREDDRTTKPSTAGLARDELESRLKRLKPLEKVVFLMYETDGIDYGEIAQALGLPMNTVASHLHRARQALATGR